MNRDPLLTVLEVFSAVLTIFVAILGFTGRIVAGILGTK